MARRMLRAIGKATSSPASAQPIQGYAVIQGRGSIVISRSVNGTIRHGACGGCDSNGSERSTCAPMPMQTQTTGFRRRGHRGCDRRDGRNHQDCLFHRKIPCFNRTPQTELAVRRSIVDIRLVQKNRDVRARPICAASHCRCGGQPPKSGQYEEIKRPARSRPALRSGCASNDPGRESFRRKSCRLLRSPKAVPQTIPSRSRP
jgi:hypothetical protein